MFLRSRHGHVLISLMVCAACSSAQFIGTGSNKELIRQPRTILCQMPNRITHGELLAIQAEPQNWPEASSIQQSITTPDGKKFTAQLVTQVNRLLRTDLKNNTFAPEQPGLHTVEFRDDQGSLFGSCRVDVAPPACHDESKKVGAYVVFVIDNSSSNSEHDCPNPKEIGKVATTPRYQCQGQTHRQKAVLASIDHLIEFGGKTTTATSATSYTSVVEFPTLEDYLGGWNITSEGWIPALAEHQPRIAQSLNFAQTPFGQTPYGSGLEGAQKLLASAPPDRPKAVVFITDGEPTDRSPRKSVQIADAIKSSEAELITVFVGDPSSRQPRLQRHKHMLSSFHNDLMNWDGSSWWIEDFQDFESYFKHLVGDTSQPSMIEKMSSLENPNCQDSSGTCARRMFEVQNSSQLETTLRSIIQSVTERICEGS